MTEAEQLATRNEKRRLRFRPPLKTVRPYTRSKDDGLTKFQRYYKRHREQRAEEQKRYWLINKELISKKKRKHYEENKEEYRKKWREINKARSEKHVAASIRWQKEHPREASLYALRSQHARRARKLSSCDGTVTQNAMSELFLDSTECCYCCRSFDNLKKSVDHIIPLVRGGPHSMKNIAICCLSCNRKKQARTPEEWGVFNGLGV